MNRAQSESTYSHLYLKLIPSDVKNLYKCFYCGMQSHCLDHVPPISLAHFYLNKTRESYYKVPSCNNCNGLASDKPHTDICDRKAYIQSEIMRKNIKMMNASKKWTDKEIRDFIKENGNTNIIKSVKAMIAESKIIIDRLSFEDYDFENLKATKSECQIRTIFGEFESKSDMISSVARYMEVSREDITCLIKSTEDFYHLEKGFINMKKKAVNSKIKEIIKSADNDFVISRRRLKLFIDKNLHGISESGTIYSILNSIIDDYLEDNHSYDARVFGFL